MSTGSYVTHETKHFIYFYLGAQRRAEPVGDDMSMFVQTCIMQSEVVLPGPCRSSCSFIIQIRMTGTAGTRGWTPLEAFLQNRKVLCFTQGSRDAYCNLGHRAPVSNNLMTCQDRHLSATAPFTDAATLATFKPKSCFINVH